MPTLALIALIRKNVCLLLFFFFFGGGGGVLKQLVVLASRIRALAKVVSF